ncbi:hypothetical protein ABIF91_008382 [Bradyrhizobium sp. USDA 241]
MVFADDVAKLLAVSRADRRLRRRPDRGRIVADVVIAGQVAAGDGQGVMQAFREFGVVAAGRPVERDVAGVDDEIGPAGVDVLADAVEVGDQARESAGRDGCRKSGSGEIRACDDPTRRRASER